MISIVIASANPQLLAQTKKNIEETVGLPHEVLAFSNADGAKGICEIYNQGIDQAQYDVLCFMHEDLALKSRGWGTVVRDLFLRQPKIGIVGIAGSVYKSIMPTGWGSKGSAGAERMNMIQSFKYINQDSLIAHANPDDEPWSRVVTVDGAWLCARKEVVRKYRFDSDTFRGFHCYDLDFCLQVGKDYDVVVTYEVLLNHLSEGRLDRVWMEETLKLFYKWEAELPKSLVPLPEKKVREIEKINFRFWLRQLLSLGMDKKIAYEVLHRTKVKRILGLKYYLKFYYRIAAASVRAKPDNGSPFLP